MLTTLQQLITYSVSGHYSNQGINCVTLLRIWPEATQDKEIVLGISLQWNAFASAVWRMSAIVSRLQCVNTLRPRQNGWQFPDDTFKCIPLNANLTISIKISLKFVPKGPLNNTPALVQIMAWRRPGDKPLSEPKMVRSPTHVCVTWPQWVNTGPGYCSQSVLCTVNS